MIEQVKSVARARLAVARQNRTLRGRLLTSEAGRKAAALALFAAAAWTWVADAAPPSRHAVAAAHDLAPGSVLTRADLAIVDVPVEAVPAGALTDPADAVGRPLAGAARAGEILTDVRVLTARLTAAAAGTADARAVPVRLADPAVAALLHPGDVVDVLAADPAGHLGTVETTVLVEAATVLMVTESGAGARQNGAGSAQHGGGPLVLLALEEVDANKVAAATLGSNVTITVH